MDETLACDGIGGQDLNGDVKASESAYGDVGGVVKESTGKGRQKQRLEGRSSSSECQPCGEYHCLYTDLPKFLVTYSPKVRQLNFIAIHCICENI